MTDLEILSYNQVTWMTPAMALLSRQPHHANGKTSSFTDLACIGSLHTVGFWSPSRVAIPNEDQYLTTAAKGSRWSPDLDLLRQLSAATVTTVSRQTAYTRLGHMGYMGMSDVFHSLQLPVAKG
ncbi:hypothetical protein TNCV_4297101 [Trichonephila clavipes]|nr:hypothetical protein TNCV_4297101 [Trichonephila clavipes]